MGFKCGIVGLPNVGKSTLFNALTQAKIAAENYPFCTIDPNVGIVPVPDPRLDAITNLVKPKQVVPTTIEFVDIAGLVKGASKGEGLGNQFLAHIRETHAIAHVVRCFENENVVHVDGSVDPQRDIDIIQTELMLADLETTEKALSKASKQSKSGAKDEIAKKRLYEKIVNHLGDGKPVRTLAMDKNDKSLIDQLHLITTKPTLYLANVAEDGFSENPYLDSVKKIAQLEGAQVVPVCASMESEIMELERDELNEFLRDMGLEEPGLHRVIRAGYQLLGLQTFFTAGPKEVRAWTVRQGCLAPQAAGVIHSDFEKGFIRAEVVSYVDYIECQGEQGAKSAGKWRSEGKDYVMQDGDVVLFRYNV